MNAVPDKEVIQEVALELGINPAFVEKDWYVVQILKVIGSLDLLGARAVFSGGTALAKAHRILQRFSEDIDFRLVDPTLSSYSRSQQKKHLSELKGLIFQTIVGSFPDSGIQVKARDENHFFSLEVVYPSQFAPSEALRPHVLVEFTAVDLSLPPIYLPVSSFVAQLSGADPELPTIACIDPVETAIDKLSALIWRVPDRIREPQDDDPDLVRHIHDLVALHQHATEHKNFKRMAVEMIGRDDPRCAKISGWPLKEKVAFLIETLETDRVYPSEYNRFVQGMSYSAAGAPSYQEAISKLKELTNQLLETEK